ncbi:MAG: type II secretion system protein [Sedimentisphaerales bacterium]|nr:type II secretion system protein [Sedimentisphaerales bacterium]
MNAIVRKTGKKDAFTIIELLTVMSIIVILIGLLVPSLNMVRRYAKKVRQNAQFHSIGAALELFNNEHDGYPPSDMEDGDGKQYCGALKLCEAMMGQDLLGFHPDSRFRQDLTVDGTAVTLLYDKDPDTKADDPDDDNLASRKGPFLPLESANAYRLWNIYGKGNTGPFPENLFVLCDVYSNVSNRSLEGKQHIGMPILYYRADESGRVHDPNEPPTPSDRKHQFYNDLDNYMLLALGAPWEGPPPQQSPKGHPIFHERTKFYEMTKNESINIDAGRPYRSDTYILISAGFDGKYGTPDDVFNFAP